MGTRAGASDVVWAALVYLPILNLAPLAKRNKSVFLLFHTRQGMYLAVVLGELFLVFIAGFVVFYEFFPWVLGQRLFAVLVVLVVAAYAVALPLMVAKVAQRKMFMLPLLGRLAAQG